MLPQFIEMVKALCTDNASVMRKTWRLLREKLPHIFTYGCAPHGFNLHAKDICKIPEFQQTVADVNFIVNYFHKHLGAGGLGTLRKYQLQIYGKIKALEKAGKTRWNSQVSSSRSVENSDRALLATVKDKEFKKDEENGKRVKELVLEKDGTDFWDRVQLFLTVMEPLRLSLVVLQGDSPTMGDVYAQWIGVYRCHSEMPAADFQSGTTKGELLSICKKRIDFLIHPLHIVGYAFHPAYAKSSTLDRAVALNWLKKIVYAWSSADTEQGQLEQLLETDFNFFFGPFINNVFYKHCWQPDALKRGAVRAARATYCARSCAAPVPLFRARALLTFVMRALLFAGEAHNCLHRRCCVRARACAVSAECAVQLG